ncbi:MAG TPA: DUF6263 family protein [Tepidisphaeraceae bacterium]
MPRYLPFVLALLALAGPPVFAQEKLDLRLRLSKDDVHAMNVTLDQTIDQTVQGVAQHITQTLNLGYTLKVEEVDDHDQATVSIHYDSIALRSKSPAGDANYDSTQPATVMPPAAVGLATLIGQSFTAVVSAEGQVSSIKGVDKLANTVLAKLSGVEGPARIAAEKVIRQHLSEAGMKNSLQNLFGIVPDRPIAVGESWVRSPQAMPGFGVILETTCTLKNRENGIATIEVAGHFSTASGATLELGQSKFDYEFHGELLGQLQVQESTGWISSSTLTQSLAGAATTRSPNVSPQSVPVTIESKIKTVEASRQ